MTEKEILAEWRNNQEEKSIRLCPRCGETMNPDLYQNALSRREDVYICDKCGTEEALEDYAFQRDPEKTKPLSEWFACRIYKVSKGEK